MSERKTADIASVPDEQFGFRADLSSNHSLLRTIDAIKDSFSKREMTIAVFLDLVMARKFGVQTGSVWVRWYNCKHLNTVPQRSQLIPPWLHCLVGTLLNLHIF